MTITLKPKVLQWARTRARLNPEELAKRIGTKPERVLQWESSGTLNFSQAEKLADKTYTPFGFLFLDSPPSESLPISDLRTPHDGPIPKPSPELIDTIELMQRRQTWMREFLISEGEPELDFVGSESLKSRPEDVAVKMRARIGVSSGWASTCANWEEAARHLRERIEEAGVLLVINGVVGNNTRRTLRTKEFRGFALPDRHAPLVFINNSDARSAQMFTIAHELAHLWIAVGGVSNLTNLHAGASVVERFCNSVAAEFLVPADELQTIWPQAEAANDPFQFASKTFKVSPIVAARRALDLGLVSKDQFLSFYKHYRAREKNVADSRPDGGDFYNNQNVRIGNRFGSTVVRAAAEGKLTFREAYSLTSLSPGVFTKYAHQIGYSL